MSNYLKNKALARTRTTEPTETDQSQGHETDVNVIVGKFLKHGTVPGQGKPPIHGDFSQLPRDLRETIELARSLGKTKARLPDQLRDIPIEELLALTPDELTSILTPPAPTPAPKEEPK